VSDLYGIIRLSSLLALLAVPLCSYSLTLLSLAEHTRALGVLRAIGFSHGAARTFLLLRTLCLTFGAFLLGTAAALVYIAARQAGGPIILMGFPFKFNLDGLQTLLFLAITLAFALAGAWLSSARPLQATVSDLLRE
jgi:ABC-type antimicrobial peptide transport system permease subunit